DGNGHIFNYIFHEGWYYIIDMTHYRTDWVATAVESGDMGDYRSTDFIAGNIHKTRDLQRYVDYVQNEYNDPPGLMFMYDAADCYALEGVPSRNGICITYEEGAQLNVLFDDPNDELTYGFAPAPKNRPNWEYRMIDLFCGMAEQSFAGNNKRPAIAGLLLCSEIRTWKQRLLRRTDAGST
ncbi:MAG: hypothetical protein IJC15_06110, partial [Clostridia bacterium]|nr:hypothetical protein [Clostridia bacterium]